MQMIGLGAPPQIARSVLPNSTETEIVTTFNFREWRHFFRLRMGKAAHPQIRQIAWLAWQLLVPLAPTCFESGEDLEWLAADIVEDGLVEGADSNGERAGW